MLSLILWKKKNSKIAHDLSELKGQVDDSVIEKMSENLNYSLHEMRKNYGENMQAFSHGEAYLKILQTRILNKSVYLLDEPEAALSPLKQLSLIAFILEVLKNKKCSVYYSYPFSNIKGNTRCGSIRNTG